MPFRRKRIRRVTMGKDPIKHSHSTLANIGNGSNVNERTIIATNAGDRSLDGAVKVIQEAANTGSLVMVSSIVKYVNITIQAAVRVTAEPQNQDTQGWLEWAVTWRDEVTIPIPSTNLGTKSLMDLATQIFRGDCIMTGSFPVSHNLPNVANITIKLPKKAVKWRLGDELVLHVFFRSADVTDLETDQVRYMNSIMFKAYN